MQIKNTEMRYGLVTIFFHWLIAIIVIAQLTLGLYMTDLPRGILKLKLYGWHKEIGVIILALAISRLLWRSVNIKPEFSFNIPAWQRFAANFVHRAFYFFLLALPLTGWLISSAAGLSISFFGLFLLPDLIAPNKELLPIFEQLHEWLAWGLIIFIVLHVLAVIQHLIVYRENILRRMWP